MSGCQTENSHRASREPRSKWSVIWFKAWQKNKVNANTINHQTQLNKEINEIIKQNYFKQHWNYQLSKYLRCIFHWIAHNRREPVFSIYRVFRLFLYGISTRRTFSGLPQPQKIFEKIFKKWVDKFLLVWYYNYRKRGKQNDDKRTDDWQCNS